MTKQEKLERIRRACIEANPSILNLKFGCEVRFDDDEYGERGQYGKVCEWGDVTTGTIKLWCGLSRYVDVDRGKITEVIGRKIGIADILSLLVFMSLKSDRKIWNVNEKTLYILTIYDLFNDDINS